jgi:site-specific DNA recombinase
LSTKDSSTRRKRAVIYLRVSSEKQVSKELDPEGLSLPSQRKRCEAHAAKLGADVVREYVEPGISASSVVKRKAFKQMLADIEQHRDVDYVIIWKVSRWARDERDLWVAYGVLQNHGVELASVSEPIDSSPTGMLLLGIMGTIAAHERRQLAVEVNRGLTQKVEVGGTPGRAPLGYRNTTQEIDGRMVRTVVLDEQRAPLIREAFNLYATGDYSLMELAAIMEERGLRSRATKRTPEQALGVNRLSSLLRNPYFIGRVRYAGKTYKGRHEPLIDEATFQDVQDLLAAKRHSGERAWRHFHYLRGSLYCGECGGRLIYMRPRGNGGTYEYFSCAVRRSRTCSQGYHRAAAVEAAIERHYVVVQLSDEQQASIRAAVEAYVGAIAKTADEKLTEAKAELARLSGEERKLLKAHYADQVSEELFGEEQARIRRERAGVERRIEELSVEHERVLDSLDVALGMLDSMQAAYCQATPNERRLLNQAFFERLEISDEEVVGYRFAEPFDQLHGQPPAEEDGEAALRDRLAGGWNWTPEAAASRSPKPNAEALNARTPSLFFEVEGSNVEALVRAEGLEPPRAEAHQDLNLARIPFRHARANAVRPPGRRPVPLRRP